MKVHYYFDWFNESMPKQVAGALLHDLPERKSLVFIGSNPADYAFNIEQCSIARDPWLEPAGVGFDAYSLIDYRTTKEDTHVVVKNASAIFFLGGQAAAQRAFLDEYDLLAAIRKSKATVIMGVSAGAMNMSAKWIASKYISIGSARYTAGKSKGTDGLGFDYFAFEAHIDMNNSKLFENDLFPLSQTIDVYVACYESVIRVKNGEMEFYGDVYLVSDSNIQKMKESDFTK